MAIYDINEQGIESLNGVKSTLSTECDSILESAVKLRAAVQSNGDVLGPHIDQIDSIIEAINTNTTQAKENVEKLTEAIQTLISKYEGIIAHNIKAEGIQAGTGAGASGGSGGSSAGGSNSGGSTGQQTKKLVRKTSSSSSSEGGSVSSNSTYSTSVNNRISSVEELKIYQDAGLKEKTVNDRVCLIRDVDFEYVDPVSGKSNLELMQSGRCPIDPKTGGRIELHHVGQEYDSPFAELTFSEHHSGGNYGILHDSSKGSWRNDKAKENEYGNQRLNHWKERAKNYLKSILRN